MKFDDKEMLFQEYVIPNDFIKDKAKYLVYGYGEIGQVFCHQLEKCSNVQLVGALDRKAERFQKEKYKVYLPNEVNKIIFDYIIIAIENQSVADSVIKFLIDCGVHDKKILWDGEKYINKQELRCYHKFMHEFVNFNSQINAKSRRFFLFMLPEHGNIGDYAIGYGAIKFLKEYFPSYELCCVTSNQWKYLKNELIQIVDNKDILFFNGGGYLGNLWGDNEQFEEIVACFQNNIKIFLPNNFTVKGELLEENENLEKVFNWISENKKLHLFFRTKNSYEIAKKYLKTAYFFPDMALNLFFERKASHMDKVLLCLREDREKVFSDVEQLRTVLVENDIEFDEWDINLQEYISQSNGMKYVQKVVTCMQQYKMIVTDRLHGMILAAISQVPVVAFDNSTHKVKGVYYWLQDIKSVRFLEHNKTDCLVEIIQKQENEDVLNENSYQHEFDKMAIVIRDLIKEESINE